MSDNPPAMIIPATKPSNHKMVVIFHPQVYVLIRSASISHDSILRFIKSTGNEVPNPLPVISVLLNRVPLHMTHMGNMTLEPILGNKYHRVMHPPCFSAP